MDSPTPNPVDRTRLETRAIHAGENHASPAASSAPDLVMSNSFIADPATGFSAETLRDDQPHVYTRWSNPTIARLEAAVASLELCEDALCFATGMAAVSGLLLHVLRPGDHLLVGDVIYAGASELIRQRLPAMGIDVTAVDTSDCSAVRDALRTNTRLLYVETPCNPILRLTDLRAVADLAHQHGAGLVVDSTLATPLATQPVELGADWVIHSLSKYLGGHGDSLGGVVAGRREAIAALRKDSGVHLGGAMSPFNAWLIHRGVATLPVRMQAHSANALRVARFLQDHPHVAQVVYPGLESHPQHALAARQMRLPSGMLTFRLAKPAGQALSRIARRLRVVHYAVSLGHVRSLLFYLPTDELLRTSFLLNPTQAAAYRGYAGDGIFRMSVGLENPDDLCADLDQALSDVD